MALTGHLIRRTLRRFAAVLAASLLASCAGLPGQQGANTHPALALGHVALAVTDLERSTEWYREAFGFQRIGDVYHVSMDKSPLGQVAQALFPRQNGPVRIAQLAHDGAGLELFEFTGQRHHSKGTDTGYLHLALVTDHYEEARAKLAELGIKPLVENTGNPAREVSFYEDPDGNVIELSSSPWNSPH